MLEVANLHEEELKRCMLQTWYDDKYKYYHPTMYRHWELPAENNYRLFAVLDKNRMVIGYIEYWIEAHAEIAKDFIAINFSDDIITFGKDLRQVIHDIFCVYNLRKMEFVVVIGNPIESTYDRLVEKYGGAIIGIRHDHFRLIDGRFYDEKLYEIMRDSFINHLALQTMPDSDDPFLQRYDSSLYKELLDQYVNFSDSSLLMKYESVNNVGRFAGRKDHSDWMERHVLLRLFVIERIAKSRNLVISKLVGNVPWDRSKL